MEVYAVNLKDTRYRIQDTGYNPPPSPLGKGGIKGGLSCIIISFLVFSLFIFHFSLLTCEAKIYIDITSPAIKKLPIAIPEFSGTEGKQIADLIRDDLEFTGFFLSIDRAAYIEKSGDAFNPKNWTAIGAEAVVKGTVSGEQNLTAIVSLYDTSEGREVLRKQYKGTKVSIRRLGHSIASDIYQHITGEKGIFGTRVAFVAEDEGKKGLYLMDWDGAGIKRLGIKGDFVLRPHWSLDGRRLVYSSERGGQWGIYLLDFTKMSEKKVFASRGLNITGNFSPDGEEIVFSSSQDETYGIYNLRLSDSKLTRITTARWIEISPVVSPDGKLVAFVSDRGGTPQIYIMSRNGYDARRITFEGSYNTSPSWSPDNKKIVFVGRVSGKQQIFIISPDGSALTRLTDKWNNEDPSFSPDGRFIIFSSVRNGGSGIYTMRANGESQKKITPPWLRAFGPRWSPN
ncbi:MAG: Tol-Pal system beta propeller repeat protein TolB [Nitrospirae bacterium CG_4_10_14_3_um_filter_44_29]|nr:MAG: Tol-Pal system beta propeller repeat protein TolB [Nitrospirae bacterium CG02_land_8_20_14_3_00_44_33]PIV67044.1 MAG: Tol-Pal system beta propeller repeat protein TolB [Nitrospirae bacterium CG01_land_8_20_14_3_00_44_22]PIW89058.1 MAG: Tol-Pal system beta propeller repeat protein TolB [Nitrospirae bacterium CG_4_8_14_3_um_filter_44_28]PIX89627.1 MAG: Tol-Pal system beta propeller repeat protein TolB [Nitrospirae bacterium CG_4_10_14_3_um_filter_44_29]PJA82107.1 MAG: Tol-Pal system beta 